MIFMKQAIKRTDEPGRDGERLQKILAQAGIASRRAAEQIILEGRVQVNGETVTELGTKADLTRDHIRVDGKLLHGREPERYFLLNKPRGYVTTMADPEGRPTVASLLGESAQKKVTGEHSKLPRLYPVGRLDYLSEGLLLMTNDGGLANRLSKASGGVQKTYLVKVVNGRSSSGRGAGTAPAGRIMIDRVSRLNEVRAGHGRDPHHDAAGEDRAGAQRRQSMVRGDLDRGPQPATAQNVRRGRPPRGEDPAHRLRPALVLDVLCSSGFRELTQGEVQALNRAAAGKSVERKKTMPEAAQLKKPVPPKRKRPGGAGSGSVRSGSGRGRRGR